MPEKSPSFLASVKAEITEAFAAQYDTLSEITSDEAALGESLKTTQKTVWDIVEKRLKESFQNGRKTTNGKAGEVRKPNPFRT